ncbi:MAG: O-antigen ligase family protein [Patescibacteria group bacterium]
MKKWCTLFLLIFISTLHRGGISIQAHLLWILGLTPLFLFTWKDKILEGKEIQWLYNKKNLTLVCGITLLTLLSFTGSQAPSVGFFGVTGIIGGIMTYLIVSQWNDEAMLRKFFQALIITACGLTVFGIILYCSTPPDRLFSTFAQLPELLSNYPNAFALFLLMITPLTFLEILESKKWWWVVAGILVLSGIILTFSRGAWLTLGFEAIACAGIFWKNIKNLPWKRIAIAVAGTIILVAAVQTIRAQSFEINTIQKKIAFKSQEKRTSLDDRLSFWKGSLKIMGENPILGTGPDTFGIAYSKYQEKLLAHSDHPHNMFLKIASETGIPTAILVLILLGFTFQAVIKNGVIGEEKKKYQIILAVALGGAIFHNLIDYNLNFASNHILFWSFLGMIEGQKESKTQEVSWKIIAAIIGILGILAIHEGLERREIAQGRNAVAEKNQERALVHFENARPIFRQDLDIMIGETGGDVEKATERNPIRADIKNILAENLAKKGETKEALLVINKVIKQDPKNWIRYYYNQEKFRRKLLVPSDKKETRKMLHEYFKLMQNNTHNTINTDNPSFAIKLANLIEEPSFAKKIRFFANIERKKFQKIYNMKLSPL